MPISLTISDLHAEFHDLAIRMGYIRAAEVPALVAALGRPGVQAIKHEMQQAEPVAEAEEQPAEKFEAPAEPEKKPRGRPRKEPVPAEVTVQDVVVAELEKAETAEEYAKKEPEYTLADVTQALRNIVKAYNYKEEPARQLFKDFGVAKISELPAEKYAAFIAASAERCEAAPK